MPPAFTKSDKTNTMSEANKVPTAEQFTSVTTALFVAFPESNTGASIARWLKGLDSAKIDGLSWADIVALPGAPYGPTFMLWAINEVL